MAALEVRRVNTILYCRRWTETVAFYRDVLGLAAHWLSEWFVEFPLAPGSFVSIADAARATIAPAAGAGFTLSLQVSDVVDFRRYLLDKGVAADPIANRWGAHCFYFHDPEGHRLEAWTPVAQP
jgi:catechol 2,3-dioxygenase-like lactoylglutathione lyase family enzyme